MKILYHIFCCVFCFVVAIAYVWYGERHTLVNPAKDENEFEQRIVVAVVALCIFIGFHVILTIRTW